MDHDGRTQKPSASDLLSSAKVVAGAAKAAARHETDKVDKGKVAGAAADLLGAASHYGKLDEKGYGKYVHKAESYLDKHRSTTTTTTTTTTTHGQDDGEAHSDHQHAAKYGDYIKMAEGVFKHKKDDDGSGGGGGGYGDYIKMAEGLLKKH